MTMSDDATWLRKQPRQQRSIERVEALLDTAEIVFGEVGYDNATTNLIAERADIPVGTLYRWFPDKAALAEGLAARYLNRLTDAYAELIASAPPRTVLIRAAIEDIARLVRENPALPAIVAVAATSTTGGLLRDTLEAAIGLMIRTLVPTVDGHDLDRIARMLTTVTFAVLGDALRATGDDYDEAVAEFSDLVIAWMSARFPPADDPVWQIEDPLIVPLAPSPEASLRGEASGIGGKAHEPHPPTEGTDES